jgi:hypothetical protein
MPVDTRASVIRKGVVAENLYRQGMLEYLEAQVPGFWGNNPVYYQPITAAVFDPTVHGFPMPPPTQPCSPR